MPQVTYKNTVFNVPDTIGGKPFLDIPASERLDYFNLIEEKNPGIFSQGEAQSFVPEDEEDDIGFFEGVKNALGRGANQLTSSLAVQANRAGVLSEEGLAEQIATDQEDVESYPRSLSIQEGLQEITEAEGFGEAGLAALTNPLAALDVAIQSIVSSAPSLVGMFAGGVAGSAISPVGTFVGAATGAGAGSYAVEFGNTIVAKMQEDGIDTTDKTAVYNFLTSPEKMAEAREYAEKRAIPIAVFDAVSGGLAGKLLRPAGRVIAGSARSRKAKELGEVAAKQARQDSIGASLRLGVPESIGAKRAGRAAAEAYRAAENKALGGGAFAAGLGTELVAQAGLGGAGEASAQIVADGHITSPGDIVLEMVAELPTGAIETAVGVRSNKKNYAKLVEAGILDSDGLVTAAQELRAAEVGAPAGAVFQSTTSGLNPTTLYYDGQNNLIGPNERIARSLIDANADVLTGEDTVTVVDKKVFRLKEGERIMSSSFSSKEQALKAASDQKKMNADSGLEFTVVEETVYGFALQGLPGTDHSMSTGHTAKKEDADSIVDLINSTKSDRIAARNNSFDKDRAVYSLMAQKKLKSKDASSKTEDRTDFSAEEFEAAATDSFTEAEIAEEIAKLPALSADRLAKVIRTITSEAKVGTETSHTLKRITKDLKKEGGSTEGGAASIEAEAQAIHSELINRKIITPSESVVRTSKYIQRSSQEQIPLDNSNRILGEGLLDDSKIIDPSGQVNREQKEYNESITRFTPEFQENLVNFVPRLRKRLSEALSGSGVDPSNVDVEIVGSVGGDVSGAIIENVNGRLLIKIAAEGQIEESEVSRQKYFNGELDHEIFHIISELSQKPGRGQSLLTKKEINQLRVYVKQVKSPDSMSEEGSSYYEVAKDIYGGLPEYQNNGVPDERLISEEAMAAAYSDWRAFTYKGEAGPQNTDIDKFNDIYSKINEFFVGLKETLSSFGDVNSIFEKIGERSETQSIIDRARVDVGVVNAESGVDSTKAERQSRAIRARAIEEVINSNVSPESKEVALAVLNDPSSTMEMPKIVISSDNRKRIANLRSRVRANNSELINANLDIFFPVEGEGGSYGESYFKEGIKPSWSERFRNLVRRTIFDDLNSIAGLSEKAARNEADRLADRSAFAAAQMAKNHAAILQNALGSALTGASTGVLIYRDGYVRTEGVTMTVEGETVVIGGMTDNMIEVLESETAQEFQLYLLAHRTLELISVGQSTGMSEIEAKQIIQESNKSFDFFSVTRKRMVGYNQKIVEFMSDTGMITKEQESSYKDSLSYIPMFKEGTNTSKGSQFMPEEIELIDINNSPFSEKVVTTSQVGGRFTSINFERKLKGEGVGFGIYIDGKRYMKRGKKNKPDTVFFSEDAKIALAELNKFNLSEGSNIEVRMIQRPLKNLFDNYVQNLSNTIKAGMKNIAAQRIIRDLIRVGGAFPKKEGDSAANAGISVLGKKFYFEVTDPDVFMSMMALNDDGQVDGDLAKAVLKIGAAPANVLRAMVTKDPGFMMANFMRDSLAAYITSGSDAGPWNSAAGLISALRDSPEKMKLKSAGIFGGVDFAIGMDETGVRAISKTRKRIAPRGVAENVTRPLRAVWNFAERMTENSDMAVRIAVYNDALKRTGNEAQAVWEAQEVLNFRRRGSHMKVLSAIIPFLNAKMQGLDVIMRGVAGKPVARGLGTHQEAIRRKMLFRAAFIGSITVLLYALGEEEDELKRASDRVRDNNWIITPGMIGLSKQSEELNLESFALTIPIPFEVGFFLKTVPDRLAALVMGNETTKETAKSFNMAVSSALSTGYPTFMVPFVVSLMNRDPLTNEKVLNPSEQRMAENDPMAVRGRKAARVDIALAEYMNAAGVGITPKEVSVIRNRLFGTIPGYFVTLFDAYSSSERAGATMKITEAPVIQRFLKDVGESAEVNQSISDLYELRIAIQKIRPKYNRLLEEGRYQEADDFLEEDGDILMFEDSVTEMLEQVKEINQYKDYINNAPVSEFSREEKRRMIDEANKMKNSLEKYAQDIFREASRI